jgi:hypothetical protein
MGKEKKMSFEAFDKIVNKVEDEAVLHCGGCFGDADLYCSWSSCHNWSACDDHCGCFIWDTGGCQYGNWDGNICMVCC